MEGKDFRLKALEEARSTVKKQVDSFGASPVLGFTKWKFFIGVAKTYLSVYVFAVAPSEFWKWHVFQFCCLLPIHFYRWQRMKMLMYFTELCWLTNLACCAMLLLWSLFPHQLNGEVLEKASHAIFALAAGPLAISLLLFRNPLVPHSIDHTMSLLIHLTPIMTAYSLQMNEPFLSFDPPNFMEYMFPVSAVLIAYSMLHSCFHLFIGLRLASQGFDSSPNDQMRKKTTVFTKVLGKLGGTGSDTVRYLKYEVVMFILTLLSAVPTYVLYCFKNKRVRMGSVQLMPYHMGVITILFCSAIWNGAGWYQHNLKRLVAGLDKLIEDTHNDGVSRTGIDDDIYTELSQHSHGLPNPHI